MVLYKTTVLKLTIKTPEQYQSCRSGIFHVDFEHTYEYNFLVTLLLTLNKLQLSNAATLERTLFKNPPTFLTLLFLFPFFLFVL